MKGNDMAQQEDRQCCKPGCKCGQKFSTSEVESRSTVAQLLGAYRRELVAEGVDNDEIRMLVIEASRSLMRDPDLAVASPRFKQEIDPEQVYRKVTDSATSPENGVALLRRLFGVAPGDLRKRAGA